MFVIVIILACLCITDCFNPSSFVKPVIDTHIPGDEHILPPVSTAATHLWRLSSYEEAHASSYSHVDANAQAGETRSVGAEKGSTLRS